MEYTVFIVMYSRGAYDVKGLLVLANMYTKSNAVVFLYVWLVRYD